METIKKYNNRKLYSTTLSKYVTLNYITELVKTDQKFQVIEVKTKKDITEETMQQSLMLIQLPKSTLIALLRGE
jgi:polyhydroxyalkanoate synthesis repressor PhaR